MKKFFRIIFFVLTLQGISYTANAQTISVSGTVYDASDKEPLPGVSVVLQGKPNRFLISTGSDGTFKVQVPVNSLLGFTYIGYENITQKITSGKTSYTISMKRSSTILEVVAIGYQKRKLQDVTGSVVTITADDIKDQPSTNVVELLQGKVSGLNIQNNNGTPGMIGTIQIRGISNINVTGVGSEALLTPTSPLFVIDGVPIEDPNKYQYGFGQAGNNFLQEEKASWPCWWFFPPVKSCCLIIWMFSVMTANLRRRFTNLYWEEIH